ncbi:MAG: tetratricopeptide repeat protein [Armatimonadetes bacterium]|nr:tetratricopeptide repeat protein [Armatimonadota bacterium]
MSTALLWMLLALSLAGWRWPGEVNRICRHARELDARGKPAEAAKLLEDAYAAEPGSAEIAYNLGTCRLEQGDHAQAVDAFSRALEAARDDPLRERIHYNRGNAFFRLDQVKEAAAEYQRALQIDPHDADAKHNLQVCLERLNPPAGAGGGGGGKQPSAGGAGGASGGGGSPGPEQAPAGMTEAEVDRTLKSLEDDEKLFRAYLRSPEESRDWRARLDGQLDSGTEQDW